MNQIEAAQSVRMGLQIPKVQIYHLCLGSSVLAEEKCQQTVVAFHLCLRGVHYSILELWCSIPDGAPKNLDIKLGCQTASQPRFPVLRKKLQSQKGGHGWRLL